jgi:hypothetical protein
MKERTSRVLVSAFLAFLISLAFVAVFVMPVHAASMTITAEVNSTWAYPTFTTTAFTPGAGDAIIIAVEGIGCPGGGYAPPGSGCNANIQQYGLTSVTDSQGDTYARQVQYAVVDSASAPNNCQGSAYTFDCYVEIWTAKATAAVSTTITGVPMSTTIGGGMYEIFDVTNANPSAYCTATGQFYTGTYVSTTNNPCALPSIYVAVGAAIGYNSGQVWTAGTSYTLYPSTYTNGEYSEYSSSLGGGAGQTNFPLTAAGNAQWIDVGIILGYVVSSPQTQIVGSCPTTATTGAHPKLVNNTIYLYYANTLGNTIVNTIQVGLNGITGNTAQYLEVVIYTSSGSTVSPSTPLNLVYWGYQSVTPSTKNVSYSFAVTTTSAIPSGGVYAVGVVGTSHLSLWTSSLSGLYTLAGNPSSQAQPSSFTYQGTSSATELALCAQAQYQAYIVTTMTLIYYSTTGATTVTAVAQPANAAFWFVPAMFLLFFPGLYIAAGVVFRHVGRGG